MKGKRDKVFVESRPHVTYLCGSLSVYAKYGCACITTHVHMRSENNIYLQGHFNPLHNRLQSSSQYFFTMIKVKYK